jgi:ParB-like chromosome segregation protein Spo0J
MVTIQRSEIHGAEYNPRLISDTARKKLKAKIKKFGMVQPIIINKRTMNIVGGHQRVSIMDELSRGEDYPLKAAVIDVDEKTEVEINVFLNNPSAMGEWDTDMLAAIHTEFPELDFGKDLGFDKLDLDFIFSGTEHINDMGGAFVQTEEQKKISLTAEEIREKKKQGNESLKKAQESDAAHWLDEDDNYMLTFVFYNNAEKRAFMNKIKRPEKEKFTKATFLFDILKDEYKF